MLFNPFVPLCVFRWNFGKPSLEIFSLNTHKTFPVGIPQGSGFFIIQYESVFIGPAGRGKSQCSPVNTSAIHGRQIDEQSVPDNVRFGAYMGICDLVMPESGNGVSLCNGAVSDTNDTNSFGNGGTVLGKV